MGDTLCEPTISRIEVRRPIKAKPTTEFGLECASIGLIYTIYNICCCNSYASELWMINDTLHWQIDEDVFFVCFVLNLDLYALDLSCWTNGFCTICILLQQFVWE